MTIAFLVIAILLIIGLCVRGAIPVLQRASIPASVIAGLIGLALAQGASQWSRTAAHYDAIRADLRGISDLAIAVVFAGLLLLPQRSKTARSRDVWLQGIAAWIIILGQLALGLFIAAIFVIPRYHVPLPFGQLIEVTMAGGFGSAKAMGTLLASNMYQFPQGADLLIFGATFGLLFGVITGIPLAKLGVRCGWTSTRLTSTTIEEPTAAPAKQVGSDVIDPLLLQAIFLVLSIGAGVGMKYVISITSRWIDNRFHTNGQFDKYLGDLPLFFFALLGGWVVRVAMQLLRVDFYLDERLIHRFTGSAIDILIVASLTTVQFAATRTYLVPTLLLLMVGSIWSIFCLLWLSHRLLPREYWFELGLINYGFSTAATAQGMMFLRLIDKDFKSGAAETYALAAPITAPFIGGGVITFAVLPPLLAWAGVMPVAVLTTAITVVLYIAGRHLHKR